VVFVDVPAFDFMLSVTPTMGGSMMVVQVELPLSVSFHTLAVDREEKECLF
jgi:hypothetical protein